VKHGEGSYTIGKEVGVAIGCAYCSISGEVWVQDNHWWKK